MLNVTVCSGYGMLWMQDIDTEHPEIWQCLGWFDTINHPIDLNDFRVKLIEVSNPTVVELWESDDAVFRELSCRIRISIPHVFTVTCIGTIKVVYPTIGSEPGLILVKMKTTP